jgi:hypothetical protein
MAEPQRRLFFPFESLELRIHESASGPRAAQWTWAALATKVWREGGRLWLGVLDMFGGAMSRLAYCLNPWKLLEM